MIEDAPVPQLPNLPASPDDPFQPPLPEPMMPFPEEIRKIPGLPQSDKDCVPTSSSIETNS